VRIICVALALLALAAADRRAAACATCSCGDPTLTATGVEQPYKNRVRVGWEERYSDHWSGTDDTFQHLYTLRTSIAATWSPVDRFTIGAFLPWVTTWLSHGLGGIETINGLGDMELSGRVLVARDRRFGAHHLFWLNAGLKMPTGPRIHDDQGYPYSDDDQPGSGSWDPFGGATYAWFSGNVWSVYASASYRYTTKGPRGYRRGSVLGWTTAAQLQPWNRVAFTLGVDGSWSQPDELSNGHASPDTGGVVVGLAPGLTVAPRVDLLVRLVVDVPLVQVLDGRQHQGPQVLLTLNYDAH
jgi:hypothetical protein